MYKCTDRQHLDEALKLVESQGGEGLMLRKPESKYIGGRSNTLLKVTSINYDIATLLNNFYAVTCGTTILCCCNYIL
jgi:DNA ligase-1